MFKPQNPFSTPQLVFVVALIVAVMIVAPKIPVVGKYVR